MNTETLRYYERRGLLCEPPRTPGGYRDYPSAVWPVSKVDLYAVIRRDARAGLTNRALQRK